MSFVRLSELSCVFGDVAAVDNIELEIEEGEFFSLMGPSGCGKTTTLRMIAGLEQPTSGTIWVDGSDVTDLPPYRRPVNTVFQHYALFPHLTVFDNIAFGLRERRLPKAEIRTRASEMMERVGLAGRGSAKPKMLSGGQQQRVALARALILQPAVLLLDEPLGALDLRLRRQMQGVLKELQREVGITFVYVTHDQEEAFAMSDRIAVMNGGQFEQLGTPAQIYQFPQTTFVADFVGLASQIEGVVAAVAADGTYDLELNANGRPTSVQAAARLERGQTVRVVLRPELGLLHREAELGTATEATAVRVEGVVRDVTFLGAQAVVRVTDDSGSDVRVQVPPETGGRWLVGDQVTAAWSSAACWAVSSEPPTANSASALAAAETEAETDQEEAGGALTKQQEHHHQAE